MKKAGTAGFHEKFDEGTLLKLKIFRAYLREWLPVFLSRANYPEVNVFDFFAGPGSDDAGIPGSPLTILEESANCFSTLRIDPGINLNLYFNDKDIGKVKRLNELVEPFREKYRWRIDITNLDFVQAYKECLPRIRNEKSANLLIIDQFGYKYIPCERFVELASCNTTDIICFMTSSNIRRFVTEEAVQRYINIPPDKIKNMEPGQAHRCVCEFYRNCLQSSTYYVAPFSIKKNANYYGLMFGSNSLLGLEKFLKVCWSLDSFTGEANYAIDNDAIAATRGQLSLFEEDNMTKKQKEFQTNLLSFLLEKPRSNQDVYRFSLENGFLGEHAELLSIGV